MIEITSESLLTVFGVAAFVAVITQLLIKPATKKLKGRDYYDLLINGISLILGIGGAVLAQLAFSELDYATTLDAVLIGLSGTALAVLGYEGVKNLLSVLKPPE
jgi:hypothetical protein